MNHLDALKRGSVTIQNLFAISGVTGWMEIVLGGIMVRFSDPNPDPQRRLHIAKTILWEELEAADFDIIDFVIRDTYERLTNESQVLVARRVEL